MADPLRTIDKRGKYETLREKAYFARAHKAENQYGRQLRKIARNVGDIVNAFEPLSLDDEAKVRYALEGYSRLIEPWARATSKRMLVDVSRRDEAAWSKVASQMGRSLKAELRTAPLGEIMRQFLNEQVALITSLPIEAAQRVHSLTLEGLSNGTRAGEIAKEILRTGEVTVNRATLIARTEVARTASGFTEARAVYVGSEGYIWRTAGDADVRASHRKMNGKFVRWDTEPVLSDGTKTHAGRIYNCRCYPEPVIPDRFD